MYVTIYSYTKFTVKANFEHPNTFQCTDLAKPQQTKSLKLFYVHPLCLILSLLFE